MAVLSKAERRQKLAQLAEQEGFDDVQGLLEEAAGDSVSPGICVRPGCDYSTEVEPDCAEGWCEACGTRSVQSALILWRT